MKSAQSSPKRVVCEQNFLNTAIKCHKLTSRAESGPLSIRLDSFKYQELSNTDKAAKSSLETLVGRDLGSGVSSPNPPVGCRQAGCCDAFNQSILPGENFRPRRADPR